MAAIEGAGGGAGEDAGPQSRGGDISAEGRGAEPRGGREGDSEQSAFGGFLDKVTDLVSSKAGKFSPSRAIGAGLGLLGGSILGIGPVQGALAGVEVADFATGRQGIGETVGEVGGALLGGRMGVGSTLGKKAGGLLGKAFDDAQKGSTEPGTATPGATRGPTQQEMLAGQQARQSGAAEFGAENRTQSQVLAPRASGLQQPIQTQAQQLNPLLTPIGPQNPLPQVNIRRNQSIFGGFA